MKGDRSMKKRMTAAIMAAALIAAAPVNTVWALEEKDVLGVWYLNFMNDGTYDLPVSYLGLEMTVEFKEDGTAIVEGGELKAAEEAVEEAAGETEEAVEGEAAEEEAEPENWVIEGETIKISPDTEEEQIMELKDGNLVAQEEGALLIFGKEKDESKFEPGEVVTDAETADFDGKWNAIMVEIEGMYVPMAMTEEVMMVDIKDGKVVIDEGEGNAEEDGMETALEEGALTLELDGEEGISSVKMQLLESGMLYFSGDAGNIYLEKVE